MDFKVLMWDLTDPKDPMALKALTSDPMDFKDPTSVPMDLMKCQRDQAPLRLRKPLRAHFLKHLSDDLQGHLRQHLKMGFQSNPINQEPPIN